MGFREGWAAVAEHPDYFTWGLLVAGMLDAVRKLSSREHDSVLSLSEDVVARSSWAPPRILFLYRFLMMSFCIGIMAGELIIFGIGEVRFFTQWSFILLICYLTLSSYSTWSLMKTKGRKARNERGRNALTYFLIVAFHVSMVAACIVDLTFWFVIYPGAMKLKDPVMQARVDKKFNCIYSDVQHGYNALVLLGEFALNDIPYKRVLSAWSRIYLTVYAVWSVYYHHVTGEWIYPFAAMNSFKATIFSLCMEVGLHVFGYVHQLLWVLKSRLVESYGAGSGSKTNEKSRID